MFHIRKKINFLKKKKKGEVFQIASNVLKNTKKIGCIIKTAGNLGLHSCLKDKAIKWTLAVDSHGSVACLAVQQGNLYLNLGTIAYWFGEGGYILKFSKHQLSHKKKKKNEAINITSIRRLLWELNPVVYSGCFAEHLAYI